jgi:hypothetical protein
LRERDLTSGEAIEFAKLNQILKLTLKKSLFVLIQKITKLLFNLLIKTFEGMDIIEKVPL